MGVVYEAWDEELGVAVALKVIRPEITADPIVAGEVERRFKRELLLSREVTHRNVVRIHDLGEIDGIKYISMSFIDGRSLAALLDESRKLSVADALKVARQIADGLAAAHEAGIVHRDLKPENVMIDSEGCARIMDFGISRATGGHFSEVQERSLAAVGKLTNVGTELLRELAATTTPSGMTTAGTVMGTLEYMAPEQAMAQPVDQRADIYAFGLMLRDMLLGDVRTAGTTALDELTSRMKHAPPPSRTLNPAVPVTLDEIIQRCVQPDPASRFQTSRELVAALSRLDDRGERIPEPARFKIWQLLAGGVVLIALVAITWWIARPRPAPAERSPVSLVIADFDNQTGDPLFEGSVEQALGIGLEGASFLTAFPRREAMRAAAQISPDAELTEANARLVSRREGVNVVISGAILRDSDGYRVTVKAIDSVSGKELASASAPASDKPGVLQAVSTVSAELRKALGDTTVESAKQAANETFTAASLQAAREYSLAQDLANANRDEEALGHYQQAVTLDPAFSRAYSGLATSEIKLGRRSDAERHYKQAFEHADRMSEREKLRTYGSYFLLIAGDNAQAVTTYTELIQKYPADGAGHNGLAIAYFNTRQFKKALAEGAALLKIYPRSVLYRYNYALYAMYAGDFQASEREAKVALELNPNIPKAYLALAMASLARKNTAEAAAAYRKAMGAGARGASLASIGLADLALYEGNADEAERVLREGIAADAKSGNLAGVAAKYTALAEAQILKGSTAAAIASARKAADSSRTVSVLLPAGSVFVIANREAEARKIIAELASRLSDLDRSGAKVIEAEIALAQRRPAEAVSLMREAKALGDLWLVTLHSGVAYYAAGSYPQALAAFEECERRAGEMTSVFLDDVPTYRYRVTLLYWLGQARAALGQASAAPTLQEFLSHRPASAADPMTLDARRVLEGR